MWKWATEGPWIKNKETDTEWNWKAEWGALYIAFKGSTSDMDWKQNLSFWIRPYKRMPVTWFAHSGFVTKWRSVEEEVLQLVTKFPDLPVKVYGFSQGGAVATLAHEAIRFHFPNKLILTLTWGAPRSVWFWNYWKIKDRFKGVFNKQKRQDIVPKLPPWWFGYLHVNRVKKIGRWWPTLRFKKVHMSYGD